MMEFGQSLNNTGVGVSTSNFSVSVPSTNPSNKTTSARCTYTSHTNVSSAQFFSNMDFVDGLRCTKPTIFGDKAF